MKKKKVKVCSFVPSFWFTFHFRFLFFERIWIHESIIIVMLRTRSEVGIGRFRILQCSHWTCINVWYPHCLHLLHCHCSSLLFLISMHDTQHFLFLLQHCLIFLVLLGTFFNDFIVGTFSKGTSSLTDQHLFRIHFLSSHNCISLRLRCQSRTHIHLHLILQCFELRTLSFFKSEVIFYIWLLKFWFQINNETNGIIWYSHFFQSIIF